VAGAKAWDELLAQFATFGRIAQRIAAATRWRRSERSRRAHLSAESAAASVEILGGLEAAGLPLDALWVTGLALRSLAAFAAAQSARPARMQRERNAPHATAARELAYAEALTAQWARAAPDVVFSFAANVDDHVGRYRSSSRRIRHWPKNRCR
jgi:hypothetical protein